jgi:hypothetical protein
VIEELLASLASRLDALGVRGGAARRVVAEARDHLREAGSDGEDEAVRRFGPIDDVARMVAAELATAGTRTATYGAFGALALAGLGFGIAFLLVPAAGGWPDIFGGNPALIGVIAAVGMLLLPQIAFVSGSLALLRAARIRKAATVGDAELRLLRRRGAIALGAGVGSLVALATYAVTFRESLAGWWVWATVLLCGLLTGLILVAAVRIARSAAPAALSGDQPGDVFEDLAPVLRFEPVRRLELPDHPWRLALLCAAAVGVVGFVGGLYGEGDSGSGLVQGGFEAVALLVCFATLGRALGLRRAS